MKLGKKFQLDGEFAPEIMFFGGALLCVFLVLVFVFLAFLFLR
ncbi:MAG TPA: hypothetical protein VF596_09540 [Pyrinomonadaceae bacterium]|jgi:hypothetical protein